MLASRIIGNSACHRFFSDPETEEIIIYSIDNEKYSMPVNKCS